MDPSTGAAGYMISGGIAGGAMSTGEVLLRYLELVAGGLLFTAAFILVLYLLPVGAAAACIAFFSSTIVKVALGAMVLYTIGEPIVDYIETGEVRHLQEAFIRTAAMGTNILIGGAIYNKLNYMSESWALKNAVAQMKIAGVPKDVQYEFIKIYGTEKLNQGLNSYRNFKSYGCSDQTMVELYQNFDAKGIALIENKFMKSAMIYSNNEIIAIKIFFKQATSFSQAQKLSEGLIAFSKASITPASFSDLGVSSVPCVIAGATALTQGITPSIMERLTSFGVKPTDYERYNITSYEKAETVAEALAKGARLLNYNPTSGAMIITTPGKTTTVLGRYIDDIQYIIRELELPKSYDFGAKPNGFNILNCPDDAYKTADQFWDEFNKPFLEQAVARGDEIILATEPVGTALRNNDGTLTGLGREFEYLTKEAGYRYDSVLKKMIKD